MHPALPVAAAAPLRSLLTGPDTPAEATSVGRHAGFVVAGLPGPARVVAVARPEAVVPPCAVVLPAGTDPRDVLTAGPVSIGGGRIRCGGTSLVVRRWWSPAALPVGTPDPVATARAELMLRDVPPGAGSPGRDRALAAARPAAAALAAGHGAAAAALLAPVLGLGPGSTPSGDDVAAAVLLGCRAAGAPPTAVDRAGAAVLDAARGRTPAVSAGLLAEAAAGRAVPPVLGMLRALLGSGDVDDALARLLALGSTSGADLATGLVAAVSAVATVPRRRSA